MKISNSFSKINTMCFSFLFFSSVSISFVALIHPSLFLLGIIPIISCFLKESKLSKKFRKGFEIFPLIVFLALIALKADLFIVISSLLVSSLSAKFIVSKEPSDYFEIFIVGLMLSLLSSIGTISFVFGIIAIFFLIASFLFLVQTQFKEHKVFTKTIPNFKDVLIYLTISLTTTFIFFYTLPRFTLGVIHGNPIGARSTSNFSTEVSINSNPVSLDYSIVMRVEKEKGTSPIYISGVRYSTFLNGKWYKNEQKEKIFPDMLSNFLQTNGRKATIYLEPNNTDVMFKIDYAKGFFGNFNYIYKDALENYYFDAPFLKTIKYDSYYSVEPLREFLSNDELKKFLDLKGIDGEIVSLGKKITNGKSSLEDKVNTIVSYLRDNNEYSLNPTANDIYDFIINHKSGYCEHFATAFVILARASNIPARLVSGFVTSEWNNNLNYYIVRAKDAHTWAEVYIGNEWIRIDPTPPSQIEVSKFSLFIDSVRMFWYKNFVTYNSESQIKLFEKVSNGFSSFGKVTLNIVSVLQKRNILFAFLLAILSAALFFIVIKSLKVDIVTKKVLELIGNDKNESETLLEFAKRKGKEKEIEKIITLYYEYRFGKNYALREEILKLVKYYRRQRKILTN